MLEAYLGRRAA